MKSYSHTNKRTCRTLDVPTGSHSQQPSITQLLASRTSSGVIQKADDPIIQTAWGKLTAAHKEDAITRVAAEIHKPPGVVRTMLENPNYKITNATTLSQIRDVLHSYPEAAPAAPVAVQAPAIMNEEKISAAHTRHGITFPQLKGTGTTDPSTGGAKVTFTFPQCPALPADAKVGFLQIVKSSKVTGAAKLRADKFKQDHPVVGENDGWTIDRNDDSGRKKTPYFGIPNTGAPGEGEFIYGGKNKDAQMTDTPRCGAVGVWKPRFETSAVIIECPSSPGLQGLILGTQKWGFKVKHTAGGQITVTKLFFEDIPVPSEDFNNAVTIWNGMVYGNDGVGPQDQIPDLQIT